jgi:hypothetical protein
LWFTGAKPHEPKENARRGSCLRADGGRRRRAVVWTRGQKRYRGRSMKYCWPPNASRILLHSPKADKPHELVLKGVEYIIKEERRRRQLESFRGRVTERTSGFKNYVQQLEEHAVLSWRNQAQALTRR